MSNDIWALSGSQQAHPARPMPGNQPWSELGKQTYGKSDADADSETEGKVGEAAAHGAVAEDLLLKEGDDVDVGEDLPAST